MTPMTLLAAQKLSTRLLTESALQNQVSYLAGQANVQVPTITSSQVVLTSAPPESGDMDLQLTYPRICIYSSEAKNTQKEKFRSFSGTVGVVAEIWASANLLSQTDQWIHFYVEAISDILRAGIGDWGDGMFFSGAYDVQFQPPKAGALGYTESAKLTFNLNVSVS